MYVFDILIELLRLYLFMIFLILLLVIDWLCFEFERFNFHKEDWMLNFCFISLNSSQSIMYVFDI